MYVTVYIVTNHLLADEFSLTNKLNNHSGISHVLWHL